MKKKVNKDGVSKTQVHSLLVDPQKLCSVRIAINYTPLSMAYYIYDSTASLGSIVLICISKERRCNEELRGVGNVEFEPVIRKLW